MHRYSLNCRHSAKKKYHLKARGFSFRLVILLLQWPVIENSERPKLPHNVEVSPRYPIKLAKTETFFL